MRLKNLTGATLSLFALFQPHAAFAEKPVDSLPRVGNWVANFDDNACHLVGQFGTGEEAVTLHMTRFAPTDAFDLKLYGERFKTAAASASGGVTFQPDAKIQRELVMLGTLGKLPMAVFGRYRFDGWRARNESEVGPSVSPELEVAVTSFDVQLGSNHRFRLLTGSMGRPMATMRTCMNGLVQHWGYDPQEQAKLRRAPTPLSRPETWVVSDDYPVRELSQGRSGIVQFRLDVDAAGKVERCSILSSTKSDYFQSATCAGLTKRARFAPAVNADGKPVRSFYVNAVRWLSPG
ncbi:MAG: TonB family protein [Novosphingobium sp.]